MAPLDPSFPSLGNVAVIGGCGFLGHHIVDLILQQYPESTICALDVRIASRIENSKVSYHECDITNSDALLSLFEKLKPDVVIHTAGLMPNPKTPDSLTKKVNYHGTLNLVEAAKAVGVKAFVYTSSSSVIIGDIEAVHNADESWPLLVGDDQPEYYSRMKAWGEKAVIEANRSLPTFLTCSIRPATMLGEFDTQVSYRPLLISGFAARCQLGDNDNLFDATYVGNVAYAHLLAAKALLLTGKMSTAPLDTEKVDGEAFIITNGTPVYFWDLMRRLWWARGWEEDRKYDVSKVWVLPAAFAIFIAAIGEFILGIFGKTPNLTRNAVRNACMIRYFCIDKARERLKYEPLWSLEEGIDRAVKVNLERVMKEKEAKKSK